MSDRQDPTDAERAGATGGTGGADPDPPPDRSPPRRATLRLVLGVAVLFALLGGLLVRVAAGASLDGFLGGALAVLVLTAAAAVFGSGTLAAASERLRP